MESTASARHDNPPPPPPRRHRLTLKRVLITLAALVLLIAALGLTIWLYLRSDAFNRYVTQEIDASLREYGLRSEIGETKISLKSQATRLSDFKLYNDKTGQLIASIKLLELDLEIREPYALRLSREIALKSLNLDGLELYLEIDEHGGSNLSGLRSVSKKPGKITLDYSQLLTTLSDSKLHLKDRARQIEADLTGIRFHARPQSTAPLNVALELESAGGRFSYQQRETAIGQLRLTGSASETGAVIDSLNLKTGVAEATANGRIDDWKALHYGFNFNSQVKLDEVARLLLPETAMSGLATADLRFEGQGPVFKIKGDLGAGEMAVANTKLRGARIEQFSLDAPAGGRIEIASGRLRADSTTIDKVRIGSIALDNFQGDFQNGQFAASVSGSQVASVEWPESKLTNLSLTGLAFTLNRAERELRYQVKTGARLDQGVISGIGFNGVTTQAVFDNSALVLNEIKGGALGGSVAGDFTLPLAHGAVSKAKASFTELQTKEVFSLLAHGSDQAEKAPLAGKISGEAEISFATGTTGLRSLNGAVKARFEGQAGETPDSTEAIPLTGQASVKIENGDFAISELELASDVSKIAASGKLAVDGESALKLTLTSTQGEQLLQLARSIDATRPFIAEYEPQLFGEFKFDARLSGRLEQALIEGDLKAETIGLRDGLLGALSAHLFLSSQELRVDNGLISTANGGSLKFNLNAPLDQQAESGKIDAVIDRVSLETIIAAAGSPDVGQFISGDISGEAHLTGLPANFNGTAQLSLSGGRIANQEAKSATAGLKFGGRSLELEHLDLALADSRLNASGGLNLGDYSFKVRANTDKIALQSLVEAFEVKDTRVDGTANADLVISGKMIADKKTELDWNSLELRLIAQGKDVKINGRDAGVLRFGARTEKGRLTFGLLTGILSTTGTQDRPELLRGSIELQKPGRPISIVGNMVNQNIAPLVELLAPNLKVKVEGKITGRLRLDGPTVDENGNSTFDQLKGGLTLTKIELQVEENPVEIATPLTFELEAMQIKVSSTRISGQGLDLSFSGKLGLMGDAGMDFALQGKVNLAQLPGLGTDYTLSGTMAIDARAAGTADAPRLSGRIDAKQIGLASKDQPIIISEGAGSITLAGDRLTLDKFTAKLNDGPLELSGESMLAQLQPSEWRFHLRARNAVINYQDIAATANGDLTLNGTQQGQTLSGTITIPQAEYAPRIDLDNLIAGGTTGLTSAGGAGVSGARMRRLGIPPIDLNIHLEATDSLIVQNKQINAVGSAALTLGGTLTNQDVTGRIESDGGTVRFRGQRYDITSGSIEFPPGAGEPQLNLTAESEISDYRVTIGFVGPVNAIELTLQSEPQLSRDELIALITTGREEIGTMTSQDVLRSGVGAAASMVTSGFISKPTEELLGLSRFTIDPVIRPNENPAARLTIGQQFARNLYMSYSTNLASEQDQTALAEYTLTSRFSALASFTQGGVNSGQTQRENNVFTIELRGRKRFSLGFSPDNPYSPKGAITPTKRPAPPKLPNAAVSVNPVEDLKLKDHKLRELLPVMTQGFSRSLARLGESRLREYLQEQGYFFAEVAYRCQPEDCSGDNLKVFYDIEPYEKYDLEQIRIEGTNQIKIQEIQDQLQSQTASRVGGVPFLKNLPLVGGYVRGLTSNDRLRNDAETIRRTLRDLGFRTASVQSRWAVRPESDSLVVIFDVVEGPQSVIAGINLRGNAMLSAQELRTAIPIQQGEAFSRVRARAGVQQINQLYEQHGFLDAKTTLELVDTAEEGVLLVYNIEENARAIVSEIEIKGLTKTAESIVRRYLDFQVGDVLTPAKIRRTQLDLYATNAFREVSITSDPIPGADKSAHKVTVKLAEAKPLLFVYGLGYSTDDGVRGLMQITDTNLLGSLDSLSLRMRASRLEQFSQLSFTDMRPFGKKLPTTVSVFYDRNGDLRPFVRPRILNLDGSTETSNVESNLGVQRFAAFIQTERKLGERTSIRFRYNLEHANLFGQALAELPDTEVTRNERAVRLGMFSFGFTHEDRDSILNPTRGHVVSFENSIALNELGGNESFDKFFGTYQTYKTLDPDFPLLKNTTFAFSARIGLAKLFHPTDRDGDGMISESETRLPITERFFTGGATTLRGFRFEAAGPQAFLEPSPDPNYRPTDPVHSCYLPMRPCQLLSLVPVGGDALAVFNFELRYPVTENFRLVPFYDLGNAFRRVQDIKFSNMTNTVGLGLRFITPIGPVGVDYGYLLNPPSYIYGPTGAILRQPRGAIHIRFGQSF